MNGTAKVLLFAALCGGGVWIWQATRQKTTPPASTPPMTSLPPAALPAAATSTAAPGVRPILPAVKDLGTSVLLPGGPFMARIRLIDGTASPAYGGEGGQYMGLLGGLNLIKRGLLAIDVQEAGVWVPVWHA